MKELNRYIVLCSERSTGPQCNVDYAWVIEADCEPTPDLLRKMGKLHTGSCAYTAYPGCEDCSGSHVAAFSVEPYSLERARQLGID